MPDVPARHQNLEQLDEADALYRAHREAGVRQAEAQVVVEEVRRGLADRRAQDLDHPEPEGDLGNLDESPVCAAHDPRFCWLQNRIDRTIP